LWLMLVRASQLFALVFEKKELGLTYLKNHCSS